jgi:hypothetical protein
MQGKPHKMHEQPIMSAADVAVIEHQMQAMEGAIEEADAGGEPEEARALLG